MNYTINIKYGIQPQYTHSVLPPVYVISVIKYRVCVSIAIDTGLIGRILNCNYEYIRTYKMN